MSDYPENYDFEKEGNATLEGTLDSVSAVQALKYGTDQMVQKFVANITAKDGTTYAVWLDSAVLNRAFREEAQNRKAIGKQFEPNEAITIEYLGKRQGATYKYKDFKVTFEFAAPSVSGFDALAGSVETTSEEELAGQWEADAPGQGTDAEAVEAPAEEAKAPTDDDIPF